MTTAVSLAALFCVLATAIHLASVIVAIARCRPRALARPGNAPVTLIRPVCGIDNYIDETLRSSFTLDHPNYELLFCVASPVDPVVGVVERLIAQYPNVRARLLIGEDKISANPKLNNIVKGWAAAAHAWIIIADSNVLMPRDYIARLFAAWREDTGLVCSPPLGACPDGLWAELECAFLNGYQARWQLFADSIGRGFTQGKTMLWRRDILESAGGIKALAAELAEDAAATKVVTAAGLRVRLVAAPFRQPLGKRRIRDVWARQVRWARLRRASFPQYFIPELAAGGLFPLIAGAFAAAHLDLSVPATLIVLALLWYGSEYLLARIARWQLAPLSPLAWMLRDLLLPILFVEAWTGSDFVWRGTHMDTADEASAA